MAELPVGMRARLAVKMSAAAEELSARAQREEWEGKRAAEMGAKDPGVIAAAVELLLQLQAGELAPVVERLVLRARGKRQPQYAGDGDGV